MHDPEVLAHRLTIPWPGHRYGLELVNVWHREPGGNDSLTVCGRNSYWRWHIHHWRLSFPVLMMWRRRLLTRCEGCGGRHTKTNPVSYSRRGRGDDRSDPLWRGERQLDHSECSSIWAAHQVCQCPAPILSNGNYGQCADCGKHRSWQQGSTTGREPSIVQRYLASIPEGRSIPDDRRAWVREQWADQWLGFGIDEITGWLTAARLKPLVVQSLPGTVEEMAVLLAVAVKPES